MQSNLQRAAAIQGHLGWQLPSGEYGECANAGIVRRLGRRDVVGPKGHAIPIRRILGMVVLEPSRGRPPCNKHWQSNHHLISLSIIIQLVLCCCAVALILQPSIPAELRTDEHAEAHTAAWHEAQQQDKHTQGGILTQGRPITTMCCHLSRRYPPRLPPRSRQPQAHERGRLQLVLQRLA